MHTCTNEKLIKSFPLIIKEIECFEKTQCHEKACRAHEWMLVYPPSPKDIHTSKFHIHSSSKFVLGRKDRYKITFIIDWGIFIWLVKPFGLNSDPPIYLKVINLAFREYFGVFMKLVLHNFINFWCLKTHMDKLQLFFNKCQKFIISLNLGKCVFL